MTHNTPEQEPATTPAIQQRVEQLAAWVQETEQIAKIAWAKVNRNEKNKIYGTSSVKKLTCEQMESMVTNAGMELPPRPELSSEARSDLANRNLKMANLLEAIENLDKNSND